MTLEEIYVQAYYGNWNKAIEGYKRLKLSPQAFSDKLETLHAMGWISTDPSDEDAEFIPTGAIYKAFTLLGYYAEQRS